MVEIEPKEFWADLKWGRKNYNKLITKYTDQWVAIVDKKVVASGESIKRIRQEAIKKTGKKHIPIIYVEDASHVY